jgi:ATP-dependent Clp protease ATP-binding subunit ClpA
MFERFTDRARRTVVAAQDEARLLGHNHIGSEHLLLGLLDVPGGVALHVLESAGITAEAARVQLEEIAGSGSKSPKGHIPFTPRAKKVLELSLREALDQGKSYIGTEHILLAVIRDSDGVGARILERLGWSLPALRQQVLEADRTAVPEAVTEEDADPVQGTVTWQLTQGYGREANLRPGAAEEFRREITMIDTRLTAIERRLGIADDEERAAGGFRALLTSVHRHLANIERHLAAQAGAPEADAGAPEPGPEPGPREPEADAGTPEAGAE